MKETITVVNAGSWGTALAILLAKKGYQVNLWTRSEEMASMINHTRENVKYLAGVLIPQNVEASVDLQRCLHGAHLVVVVVPSHGMREIAQKLAPLVRSETILVSATKGIETDTLMRMTEVLKSELPAACHERIGVLSGPNHAEEVSRDVPSATVIAAEKRWVAEYIQDVFMTPKFRVYTNPDVIGVELGGALKNIIALAAGISDGLGFGDNSKAALMTRGIAEIARLGIAMGAQGLTFAGLAGVGDLIATCTSRHSRNLRAGQALATGKTIEEVLASTNMVVEGVRTTKATYALAQKYGIEMPITQQLYEVLFNHKNPKEAVVNLMMRGKTHEIEEVVMHKSESW